MMQEIIHSVLLVITIALSFLFPHTPFAQYDLQLSALLFICIFLLRKINLFSKKTRLFESIAFTLIIGSIVSTTGSVNSPYFFLLYFLLFALSLLLEPIISLTATITFMAFLVAQMPADQSPTQFVPIVSLAILTPFALLLGNDYLETQRLKKKLTTQKENTFLFLSLLLKNQMKRIHDAVENYKGDVSLHQISQSARSTEKLIDMFEKQQP